MGSTYTGQEQGPAADAVDEEGGTRGPKQVPNLHQGRDERLLGDACNADRFEHKGQVVADNAVAHKLGEDTNGDGNP